MEARSELFAYLETILSPFKTFAQLEINRIDNGDEKAVLKRITTYVTRIEHALGPLKRNFGDSQWEKETASIIGEILDILDAHVNPDATSAHMHPPYSPTHDRASSHRSAGRFAGLDALRCRVNRLASSRVPLQLSGRTLCDKSMELSDWTDKLEDQKHASKTANDLFESSQKICRLADKVHSAISPKLQCECGSQHQNMLCMESHRGYKANGRICFDVLCGTRKSILRRWQKSRVTVVFGSHYCTPEPNLDINNFCSSISGRPYNEQLNMIMSEHKSELHQLESSIDPEEILELVGLDKLLTYKGIFGLDSKLILAGLLSNSVLNLQQSPWMPAKHLQDGIYFPKYMDGIALKPWIQKRTEIGPSTMCESVERQTLGALLLQIFLWEPISCNESDAVKYKCDLLDKLDILKQREESADLIPPIEACLLPQPPDSDVKSRSTYVYSNVIIPLERILRQKYRIRATELDEQIRYINAGLSSFSNGETLTLNIPSIYGDEPLTHATHPSSPSTFPPPSNSSGSSTNVATAHNELLSVAGNKILGSSSSSRGASSEHVTFYDTKDLDTNSTDHAASDAWFEQLEKMHDFFEKEYESLDDPKEPLEDIRIAVLDTGISKENHFIRGKKSSIKEIMSFVPGNKNTDDLDGHGTHLVGLVLKVAPYAKIYVARVTEYREIGNEETIAKAITHATDVWKVNIINMSFGFERETSKTECIRKALLNAYGKDIAMFAATHNDGGVRPVAFPANRMEVIGISSTDAMGKDSRFSPFSESKMDFRVLGESVLSSGTGPGMVRKNGTSIATPIAVGIAASVMHYVNKLRVTRDKRLYGKDDSADDLDYYMKRVTTPDGIRAILEYLALATKPWLNITPWNFLRPSDRSTIPADLLSRLKKAHS